MVINSQHNSTDVASSLVAGMMGTLLALVLVLALTLALALALVQGERKPYLLEASCLKVAEVKEGIGLVKEYGDK